MIWKKEGRGGGVHNSASPLNHPFRFHLLAVISKEQLVDVYPSTLAMLVPYNQKECLQISCDGLVLVSLRHI